MSFEIVNTQYFDADAIRLPAYRVGRLYAGSGRFYIRINQDGTLEAPFRAYISLTTLIGQSEPMNPGLLKWNCDLGYDEARRIMNMKAKYGTHLHNEIGLYLTLNYYDFDTVKDRISAFLTEQNYYQPECDTWEDDIKYDMVAFIAFAQEYQIKPLGIEYVLLSDRGYGTMIDLVCNLQWPEKGFHGEAYKSGDKKGLPKETTVLKPKRAIINFKSGRHAFYSSHGLQIELEKRLWEENFPDLPIDMAMNWSPKEWRSEPSWNLKDWTGTFTDGEIDAVIAIGHIRYDDTAMNKRYLSISGQAFTTRPVSDCLTSVSVEEYAIAKYSSMMGALPETEVQDQVEGAAL